MFGCRFLTSLVKGIFFSLSFFFSVFILSLPSIVIIAVINSNIVYDPGHKYILFLLGAHFNDLRFEKTSTITIRNTDKLIQSQTLAPSRTRNTVAWLNISQFILLTLHLSASRRNKLLKIFQWAQKGCIGSSTEIQSDEKETISEFPAVYFSYFSCFQYE